MVEWLELSEIVQINMAGSSERSYGRVLLSGLGGWVAEWLELQTSCAKVTPGETLSGLESFGTRVMETLSRVHIEPNSAIPITELQRKTPSEIDTRICDPVTPLSISRLPLVGFGGRALASPTFLPFSEEVIVVSREDGDVGNAFDFYVDPEVLLRRSQNRLN